MVIIYSLKSERKESSLVYFSFEIQYISRRTAFSPTSVHIICVQVKPGVSGERDERGGVRWGRGSLGTTPVDTSLGLEN